jgi:hypothetical protein
MQLVDRYEKFGVTRAYFQLNSVRRHFSAILLMMSDSPISPAVTKMLTCRAIKQLEGTC